MIWLALYLVVHSPGPSPEQKNWIRSYYGSYAVVQYQPFESKPWSVGCMHPAPYYSKGMGCYHCYGTGDSFAEAIDDALNAGYFLGHRPYWDHLKDPKELAH